MVDDAAPFHAQFVESGPKLIEIDLGTDAVSRVYPIPLDLMPPGAVLGHVRVDQTHAYVTESTGGAFIIVDRKSGQARRVLSGHPKMMADPTIVPVIDGKEFRQRSGKVPRINTNLLELSLDGEWLYFTCLFGPMLRRVPVERLIDF